MQKEKHPVASNIIVKCSTIRTLKKDGIAYLCITDIARQKNPVEPKDVVKNWMRVKNTLEYLGLWEMLNNPKFKGVEFDPLLKEAGSNSFTMSPNRWIFLTDAIGIVNQAGRNGGTYAQRDIAFKFASWVSVEFELYLIKEFQRLKEEEQRQLGWSAKRELSKKMICLSNMENLNAVFIEQGMTQSERIVKLNQIAIQQMSVLERKKDAELKIGGISA